MVERTRSWGMRLNDSHVRMATHSHGGKAGGQGVDGRGAGDGQGQHVGHQADHARQILKAAVRRTRPL